jgi:hypothetical protein
MTDDKKPESWTYFIQPEKGGDIKIGYTSRSPLLRLSALQTGCPDKLKIVGLIKGNLEKDLHTKFENFNTNGEWFKNTKHLRNYIKANAHGDDLDDFVSTPSPKNPKNKGKVIQRTENEINRFTVSSSGPNERFIDFDFVFERGESPFGYDESVDHGFDYLEEKMTSTRWNIGCWPSKIWHEDTWEDFCRYEEEYGDELKKEYNIHSEEDWYECKIERECGASPAECEMDVIRQVAFYVHPVNDYMNVRLFNKVCVSLDMGVVYFMTSAVESMTKIKIVKQLSNICEQMDEYCHWGFLLIDEDHRIVWDLNYMCFYGDETYYASPIEQKCTFPLSHLKTLDMTKLEELDV